jgi:hypothetical protein
MTDAVPAVTTTVGVTTTLVERSPESRARFHSRL